MLTNLLNSKTFLMFILSLFCKFRYILGQDSYQLHPQHSTYSFTKPLIDNFEYGVWTFYVPFSNVKPIGPIKQSDSNCSLIHYISLLEIEELVFYQCFDYSLMEIRHEVKFISNDDQVYTQTLIIYTNTKYEGTWYYYHLVNLPAENMFRIIIFQLGQILNQSIDKKYNNLMLFHDGELVFHFGGSKLITNEKFDITSLATFLGKIIVYQIHPTSSESLTNSINKIQSQQAKYLSYESCTDIGKIPFSQILIRPHIIYNEGQVMVGNYQVIGWFKVLGELNSGQQVEFITISPITKIADFYKLSDIATCKLFYLKSSQTKFGILLKTYSYKIPLININPDELLVEKYIEIDDSFKGWHFVLIQYKFNELRVSIWIGQTQNQFDFTSQAKQFSNYAIQLTLGADLIVNDIGIQVNSVEFNQCNNIEPGIVCDISCATCSGPTSTDCTSCQTEYNRVFDSNLQTCNCKEGSLDYQGMCILTPEFLGFSIKQIELQKQEPIISCSIGDIMYNEKCINCPGVQNGYARYCNDCQRNENNNWLDQPRCQSLLQSGSISENYRFTYLSSADLYIYQFDEFYLCEYCEQLFPIPVGYPSIQHLDQDMQIFCKTYYQLYNNKCIRSYNEILPDIYVDQSCGQQCNQCDLGYCLNCLDFSQYYISIFQPLDCIPCLVKNCKYCFDYSLLNYQENSYVGFGTQRYIQYDDMVSGCSLCIQGFKYNFVSRECEVAEITKPCLRQVINQNNEAICLLSELLSYDAVSYRICDDQIPNCLECIRNENEVICIKCINSFKVHQMWNQCIQCQDTNTYQCTYQFQYDSPHFYYISDLNTLIYYLYQQIIFIDYDYNYEYAIDCQFGYKENKGKCEPDCSKGCTECSNIYNGQELNDLTCLKCDLSQYGQINKGSQALVLETVEYYGYQYEVYSLRNNCWSCPYNCQYCFPSPGLYNKLNPHYSSKSMTESKCGISNNKQKIDQNYGRVKSGDRIINYYTQYLSDSYETMLIYEFLFNSDPYIEYKGMLLDSFSIDEFQYKYILTGNITYENPNAIQTTIGYNWYQVIFTLTNISLVFQSPENQQFQLPDYFVQFNTTYINNIQFYRILFQRTHHNFIHKYQDQIMTIIYETVYFYESEFQIKFTINFVQFQYLRFSDVKFMKYNIYQSTMIQYQSNIELIENSEIFLQDLVFEDLIMKEITFLNLGSNAKNTTIQIFNFTIKNSQLMDSIFLDYTDTINNYIIEINELFIINSQFLNSTLFHFPPQIKLTIKKLIINNSNIYQSNILSVSDTVKLENIYIDNTNLTDSFFFTFIQINQKQNLLFEFINFKLSNLFVMNSQIINILLKQDTDIKVSLQNFTHYNIQDQSIFKKAIYQFKKSIQFSIDQQLSIQITIDQFIIDSDLSNVYQKLPFWKSCFTQFSLPALIEIEQYKIIKISNFIIQNQIIIDSTIININLVENQLIFENIAIQQNLLVNKNNGQQIKLFNIYSQQQAEILFQHAQFSQNMIHYYLFNFLNDGIFIILNTQYSNIQIKDCQITNNFISNTSSTFFQFYSDSLLIDEIIVQDNNHQPNEFFIQNPNPSLNSTFTKLFYKSRFQVFTAAGLGVIGTEQFYLKNSNFLNGYSYQHNLFKMICKETCYLNIYNTTIQNQTSFIDQQNSILSQQQQYFTIYGCIYIDSYTSTLQIEIDQINLESIYNKLESAFIYINPSQISNRIKIINLIGKNIYSLKNGFLCMDFEKSKAKDNFLLLKNIHIVNKEDQYKSFISQIFLESETEISYISIKNSFIYASYSTVSISNFSFTGYLSTSLLQFENAPKLTLNNLMLIQSLLNQLMLISTTNTIFNNVIIQELKEQKVLVNSSFFIQNSLQLDLSRNLNCQLIISELLYIQINQFYSSEIVDYYFKLNLLKQNKKGFIEIAQIKKNLSIIGSQFINIVNPQGFIYIESSSSQINIEQSVFIFGIYNTTGHVTIQSDGTDQITILNSKFASSQCNQGCGLNILNASLLTIKNTQFNDNIAVLSGGGLRFASTNMKFQNVQFIGNKAEIGAALDIENMQLKEINQAMFEDNTPMSIREVPQTIQCQYNNRTLPIVTLYNDSKIIQRPSYKQQAPINRRMIFSNNQSNVEVNYIQLPSNIPFQDYRIFNESEISYSGESFSLQFQALNQIQEIQHNLTGTDCTIYQKIINQNNNSFIEEINQNIRLLFDNLTNSYILKEIQFDPYSSQQQLLQLIVQCDYIINYEFQLNIRTYYCQMGEYYQNEGCYKCDFQKGYYSVNKNQIKCLQMDINKIKSITENQLNLKIGFWRSTIYSEEIEKCLFSNCLGGWDVGIKSCQVGYIGALCEECDIGNQYTKISSQQCLPCKDSWEPIITLIIVVLWTFLFIYLTVRSVHLGNKAYRELLVTCNFYKIFHKFNQDSSSCLIKMLVSQLLIITAIYQMQIDIPVNIQYLQFISSPSLTTAFNFDCWLSQQNYIELIYLRILQVLIIPFIYISVSMWAYLIYTVYKNLNYDSSNIFISLMYIFIITQPDIIKYCGSLLASRKISGIYWIQANVSYQYYTDTHSYWLIFGIMPILFVWCFMIPFYLWVCLFVNRKKLGYSRVRRKLSYLYREYNEQSYYWEIVNIIQRELQVLILTVFKSDVEICICLLFVIQFGYLQIVYSIKPFNLVKLSSLEIKSNQKCIFILILGILLYVINQKEMNIYSFIIQVLLMITTIIHLLPFLYELAFAYFAKYETIMIEKIKNIRYLSKLFVRQLNQFQRKQLIKQRFKQIKIYLLKQNKLVQHNEYRSLHQF